MAEKAPGACARAVGAGLEHYNVVTGLGVGQQHAVGKDVQRRAQGPYDRYRLVGRVVHPVSDAYRVVLADDLAKVA